MELAQHIVVYGYLWLGRVYGDGLLHAGDGHKPLREPPRTPK